MQLDHRYLTERLDYDPVTGVFTWRDGQCAGQRAGYVDDTGYRRIKLLYRKYRAGRLAWFYVHGEWPPVLIDHRNRIRDDDRLDNLRPVDHLTNTLNSVVLKKPVPECWLCGSKLSKQSARMCRDCYLRMVGVPKVTVYLQA